ncbi:MAG: putative Uroporphyrinogen decarboxylase (URO-D) [Promethearchaeota archaeon]|nr:MAG: putative Uroporphyrinogen decarboxylase (URO-D) [Candidatus Lokiarchaeota archaeon]
MFRIIGNILKGKMKTAFGKTLNGDERFILTSLYSKTDRVATLITASNVHPKLIDPNYDFVKLTSSVEANLELFQILQKRFPEFDAAMPASWLGLAGCGLEELGTSMRITPMIEPTPYKFALDKMKRKQLSLPEKTGYLEKQITLLGEVQDRFAMNAPPIILGAFDLAMLLRGEKLISDFRIFRDYENAQTEALKKKIEKKGNPHFFPKLLEFTTKASIRIGQLYKEHGVNMLGIVITDQYANPPLMSPADFLTYIYPYVETVWKTFKKYRPTVGYMPPSPAVAEEITEYSALSGIACFNNYMFPQDEMGLTPAEYDVQMVELSQKLKTPYQFLIHGKFLRDCTEKELEKQIIRVCELVMNENIPLSIGLAAVPLGTDISKVDIFGKLINKYGVYK